MWVKDRLLFNVMFYISIIVLCVSLLLQYYLKLEPCPLCIMQRLCLLLILLCSGIVAINPRYTKLKSFWIVLIVVLVAGCYFAFRQLYLQSLPPGMAPPCLPSLNLLVQYYPLALMLKALFLGSGSCAVIEFKIIGLSLAFWSAIYFILMAGLAILAWRGALTCKLK